MSDGAAADVVLKMALSVRCQRKDSNRGGGWPPEGGHPISRLLLRKVDYWPENGAAIDNPFRSGAVGGVRRHEHQQLRDLLGLAHPGNRLACCTVSAGQPTEVSVPSMPPSKWPSIAQMI